MPVLPLVGSTMTVPAVDFAIALAGLDHGDADAVFDAGEGIEEFAFGQDDRAAGGDDAVEADEGRAAHGVDDAVVDLAFGLAGHGDPLLFQLRLWVLVMALQLTDILHGGYGLVSCSDFYSMWLISC